MRSEINLKETLLKNRWGRDQKIKPGSKVRLAPFESKKSENETDEPEEFLRLMTEGLKDGETYAVRRIGQLPDDGTIILYLAVENGRVDGYYAEYLQAVDERKIKAVEFPFSDADEVVAHLKTITNKECYVVNCEFKPEDVPVEEKHLSNEWIILPATVGRCKVTMDGEPRELNLNPEKIIVIPVPAGKRHSLLPISGFSSYRVLCEGHEKSPAPQASKRQGSELFLLDTGT
ncbi:MAG: hypothetical protein R6W75_01080 [Smithellaceae bacterium]